MLDFFRRYQRYFFFVITIVIIISFSFFGTYSTLGSNTWREQIAFKAVNGHDVTRLDVDEMALFLATDNEDKLLYGGAWGPNFLNDGVIRKDFLQTGIAQELALAYREDLQADMDKRLAKEKKYTLYTHPQARFLSVEGIWNYFAPSMKAHFDTLRASTNGLDPAAFDSRVKLYLGEKQIPAPTLRQVLRYQEKQYNWLTPDDRLNQIDLSLFGYHTLEDWFGSHFTRLVSEFIINAAILAEAQGYQVSKAEALADLVRNTQISYQQNRSNPNLGVTSPEEYFSEQLRRLNMDQARAVKIWRQVLLFRRYFQEAGATALVDTIANQQLHQFGHENVTVDFYRLPSALRLTNYQDLQNFEIYLQAVAKVDKKDPLALPQQFLTETEVAKSYPELVQKKYELEVAQVSQKALQARIGLRELWNWEVNNDNWQALKKQFPDLGTKEGNTREDRFDALDSLEPTIRAKVDFFAKQEIVKAHPEWIEQALNEAQPQKMVVGLRTQGGKTPFAGLDQKEQRQAFIKLLDQAPLGTPVDVDSPLYCYTANHQTYYRLTVLDRANEPEILTFSEAQADKTLDEVRDRVLEKYYTTIREKFPEQYQREDKSWKSFSSVRDAVADQYFEDILQALEPIQKMLFPQGNKTFWSKDQAASLRFYSYLKQLKEQLEKDPTTANQWVKAHNGGQVTSLKERPALVDQWKVEKQSVVASRQAGQETVDPTEALELKLEAWSALKTPSNGDLTFFQVKERGVDPSQLVVMEPQVKQVQSLLGNEAQRHLMSQVLQELKNKEALSLAYLQIPQEDHSEPDRMEPNF
jgi:GcvH upstream region-like protein